MSILVNFHCHSTISDDARNTMTEMALAAQAAGVTTLCFTDHCDMLSGQGALQDVYDWGAAEAAFAAAQQAVPGLDLRLGLELGCPLEQPELATRMLNHPHIDFVIGSIHNSPSGPDYYYGHYTSPAQCQQIFTDYLAQVLALARSPYYDVLGHLDYPARYMQRAGIDAAIDPAHPLVREILQAVIASGRGIECNTSGYRDGGSTTFPSRALLQLYHDMGGTRLTIGTDAHNTAQIALGLPQSLRMLHELGFRALTIYRDRIPQQIDLEELL